MLTQTEIMLLCSYIYNNKCNLENEVRQIQNNVRFRNVDVPDCVELACAVQRLETFNEVTSNILALLKITNG